MEGLSKKEKDLMDMNNGMVIGGIRVGSVRGLSGYGKHTIKILLKILLNINDTDNPLGNIKYIIIEGQPNIQELKGQNKKKQDNS